MQSLLFSGRADRILALYANTGTFVRHKSTLPYELLLNMLLTSAAQGQTSDREMLRVGALCAWFLLTGGVSADLHCATEGGLFIGLVCDHTGIIANGDSGDRWEEVNSWSTNDNSPKIANHSFVGCYMQTLPDDGDTYSIESAEDLHEVTSMRFPLRVTSPGVHTLAVRWTAGDTVGGGDSLYVTMRRASDDGKGAIVSGLPTWRIAVEEIGDSTWAAGCCYDSVTHECHCLSAQPSTGCGYWAQKSAAAGWGAECEVGHGAMQALSAPQWYEFAGQDEGNVMDFNSEPFDATCEANGAGTRDTGSNLAQWELAIGTYDLVFSPREDGVALDAWYLAEPGAPSPPVGLKLATGASTLCGAHGIGGGDGDDWGADATNDWRADATTPEPVNTSGDGEGSVGGIIAVTIAFSVFGTAAVGVGALVAYQKLGSWRRDTRARGSAAQRGYAEYADVHDAGGKTPIKSTDALEVALEL